MARWQSGLFERLSQENNQRAAPAGVFSGAVSFLHLRKKRLLSMNMLNPLYAQRLFGGSLRDLNEFGFKQQRHFVG